MLVMHVVGILACALARPTVAVLAQEWARLYNSGEGDADGLNRPPGAAALLQQRRLFGQQVRSILILSSLVFVLVVIYFYLLRMWLLGPLP